MHLNKATIKANYPTKRLEPIIKKIGSPWLKFFFETDASNGYWVVGVFPAYAYRLTSSSVIGQICYLRIGQRCTSGPGTYTQSKFIVTSEIRSPDPEPSLSSSMPEQVVFIQFVDDDIRGADSFKNIILSLHNHYFL